MLKQIEKLEKAGLYKEADTILRKVISEEREYATQIETETSALDNLPAQQGYSQNSLMKLYTAYRPLAVYLNQKYSIDLFALPKNLDVLMKATSTGQMLPDNALKFPQAFYKDMRAIKAVEDFLENYPNVSKDLKNINSQFRFLKNKNYWDWLSGIKDTKQFNQELQEINGLKTFSKDFYNSEKKILNISKLEPNEIKNIKDGFESSKQLSTWNAKMKQYLVNADPQKYNYKLLDTLDNEALLQLFKSTPKLNTNQVLIDAVEGNIKAENYAQKLIQNAEQTGKITAASADGTQAAASIVKKFPILNRILGPLGIILSLPAAIKWTKKILSGEDFTNEEIVECIQDLLNLSAAVAFVIPGGQLVSAVLGGLSLTLMGGSFIAKQFETKEEPKEKQERDINELVSQATPDNFSDFNEWLKSKNMSYSTMKIIDILKALETWIPQSQFAKEFDWFVNPNEQNKSKRAIFEQKYLNLFNAYRKGGNISQSGASLAFNSLEDVKKAYDRQFSQNPFIGFAFRQSKPLKEIISTIQKEMAPGMPAGQKWFAEVPLNYSDKDLLAWYNLKYPNGVVTASANKIIKTATTFNLKKHKLAKTNS